MKNINEMTDEELLKFVKKHGGQTDKFLNRDTSSIGTYESIDLDKLERLKLELLEFAKENNFSEKSVYFNLELGYNDSYSDSQSLQCFLTSTEKVPCSRKELEGHANQVTSRLESERKHLEYLKKKFKRNLKMRIMKTIKISI